jgi:hypothetical protein
MPFRKDERKKLPYGFSRWETPEVWGNSPVLKGENTELPLHERYDDDPLSKSKREGEGKNRRGKKPSRCDGKTIETMRKEGQEKEGMLLHGRKRETPLQKRKRIKKTDKKRSP